MRTTVSTVRACAYMAQCGEKGGPGGSAEWGDGSGTVGEFTAIIAQMEKWGVVDLARVSKFSGGVRIAPVAVRAMGV
jgi:hypothetical protein